MNECVNSFMNEGDEEKYLRNLLIGAKILEDRPNSKATTTTH